MLPQLMKFTWLTIAAALLLLGVIGCEPEDAAAAWTGVSVDLASRVVDEAPP